MSIFNKKTNINNNKLGLYEAPAFDPYGKYKNSRSGLFGLLRKDNHVIMPGVTSYEEIRLKGVKEYVKKVNEQECTLPQEMINDIYSMYVNSEVKRRPKDKSNTIRHKVLNKVYNSLTKVVTEDSPLYTQILTRELALVLQKIEDELKEEQEKRGMDKNGFSENMDNDSEENKNNEENSEDSKDSSQSSKSGNSSRQSYEDAIDNLLNKHDNNIKKALDDADEKIKDLENKLGKEAMKDLSKSDPDFLEKIDELKNALSNVSFNKSSIKKVLEKILNESMNYFSQKFSRIEESIFDCEECEDLFGLENLHPVFKNAKLFDVSNESRIYKGKIDLYLDCSGSMNYKEKFEGNYLRMIDLVKGIAMTLYRMGMIENLYFFDHELYEIKNINEISILSFSQSGGTDFNKVVKNIKEKGNNSVIITDGEDSCNYYDKRAFWIGVGGTRFSSYYGSKTFNTYKKSKQCVTYNSANSNFEYCLADE